MKTLDFQQQFLSAVNQILPSEELLAEIIPIGDLSILETIRIYRTDYVARLSEVLGELFETVWMILGDEDFKQVCEEYIQSHPSSFQNLAHYGEQFPSFLGDHALSQDFPFLAEVAQFEKCYWSIFHQSNSYSDKAWPDEQDLTPELKLKLDPNTILFSSPYSCLDLFFHRNQSAQTFKGEINKPQFALLFKVDDLVKVLELTRVQFELLDSLNDQALHEALSSLELLVDTNHDTLSEIQNLFVKLRNSSVPLLIE